MEGKDFRFTAGDSFCTATDDGAKTVALLRAILQVKQNILDINISKYRQISSLLLCNKLP